MSDELVDVRLALAASAKAESLPTRAQILARIAASLLGSYAFVWGLTSLGIALGVGAGMSYREAQTLLFLLAFLVFLACFCWAFVAARLARVWAVLAFGGALMTVAAWLLSHALV